MWLNISSHEFAICNKKLGNSPTRLFVLLSFSAAAYVLRTLFIHLLAPLNEWELFLF
jgi:hypothetical protein